MRPAPRPRVHSVQARKRRWQHWLNTTPQRRPGFSPRPGNWLKRGVKGLTVAEIAEKAHVGKGTAYLYWGTKQDLLFGLFARDFLTFLEGEIQALGTDPDACRPQRLCPQLARNA